MKKARATKILCAVLTVMMVLGTGLSAMAATSTSTVKYSADKTAYGVTTEVTGLAENEMVTYLVHNADSMYNVTASNIDYIDQKNADGTTATFNYNGTGDWATKKETIYVGAESLAAPITGIVNDMEEGVEIRVNGVLTKGLNIVGKAEAGVKTIALSYADEVVDVRYNNEKVDFFKTADSIGFFTEAALDEKNDKIAITTAALTVVGDPTADGVLSAADIIAMGKAIDPATQTTVVNTNGTISGWAGILSNIRGNSQNSAQGETGSDGFWYPNTYSLADSNYDVSAVTVEFNEKCLPIGVRLGDDGVTLADGNEWPATVAAKVLADYQAGSASTTIDASKFVANGITLNNAAGKEIELEFVVAVPGNYKLVSRAAAWDANRRVQLVINDKTLTTVRGANVNTLTLGLSEESVYLDAGTYTAKLNANVSDPVRMDFIAMIPATAAADEAYQAGLADDKAAVMDYLAAAEYTEGEVGVKLGTFAINGNELIAFGRAKGAYTECGICISEDGETATEAFPAHVVSSVPGVNNGGFAIQLVAEEGADLAAEYNSCVLAAYAVDADSNTILAWEKASFIE